eukprot:3196961-Prymnesium_polylepis.1
MYRQIFSSPPPSGFLRVVLTTALLFDVAVPLPRPSLRHRNAEDDSSQNSTGSNARVLRDTAAPWRCPPRARKAERARASHRRGRAHATPPSAVAR